MKPKVINRFRFGGQYVHMYKMSCGDVLTRLYSYFIRKEELQQREFDALIQNKFEKLIQQNNKYAVANYNFSRHTGCGGHYRVSARRVCKVHGKVHMKSYTNGKVAAHRKTRRTMHQQITAVRWDDDTFNERLDFGYNGYW